MNLRSIQYFLVTAEEMNFTKAAERLFISQQALSSHIARLEAEYHVQFFERKPTLRLTRAGEEMCFYGRQIIDAESKMRAAFSDIRQNCLATLKVGISRLRGNVFFPSIWSHYHPSHPNISVELVDGHSTQLDEMLQLGKIDLYIGINVPPNTTQQKIHLAHENLQCCMSQNLLAKYRPDTWQEVLEEFKNGVDLTQVTDMPFITLRQNNRIRKGLDQFWAHQTNPHYVFETDQQELIYELSKSGAGIGLASPIIFYQHMAEVKALSDSFYVFPILNDIQKYSVNLVYRRDYPLPAHTMDFIQTTCMVFRRYASTVNGA